MLLGTGYLAYKTNINWKPPYIQNKAVSPESRPIVSEQSIRSALRASGSGESRDRSAPSVPCWRPPIFDGLVGVRLHCRLPRTRVATRKIINDRNGNE